MVISSWQSLKDWEEFKASAKRVDIDRRIETFLVEPARFSTYRYLSFEQAIKEGGA